MLWLRQEDIVGNGQHSIAAINCVFGALFVLMIGLLYYIREHIIVPFGRLNDVPQELARGNLAVPIPEEKSRFFGKFTWGVNLLRESIEDSRKKEITMQRDKKLLLLSLWYRDRKIAPCKLLRNIVQSAEWHNNMPPDIIQKTNDQQEQHTKYTVYNHDAVVSVSDNIFHTINSFISVFHSHKK